MNGKQLLDPGFTKVNDFLGFYTNFLNVFFFWGVHLCVLLHWCVNSFYFVNKSALILEVSLIVPIS